MIHVLPTVLSEQAVCGKDIPANAKPCDARTLERLEVAPELFCTECYRQARQFDNAKYLVFYEVMEANGTSSLHA